MREVSFDGLVGPTHTFAGLSYGNVASERSAGEASSPRSAAREGLAKMRLVRDLGALQAVLPPQPRPSLSTLRALGFRGSDEEVLARAAREEPHLLRLCSSAASMWAANAATVVPSCDAGDGLVHFVPANLTAMFHRSIEASTTTAVLRAIFADGSRFAVHDPLPGGSHFADEGAANHLRLATPGRPAVHVFAWGRRSFGDGPAPRRYPARQTLEASRAVARLCALDPERVVFAQQHPDGIDAGAFHTDVLAVGSGALLLAHELAFLDTPAVCAELRAKLGDALRIELATNAELPVGDAVLAYPFNAQIVTREDGAMVVVAPAESGESPRARAYLERVAAACEPALRIEHVGLRQSMKNGGGPACLRLRVPLEDVERAAIRANVFLTDALHAALLAWIDRHYRDRLEPSDHADPALARESMAALDELTRLLGLGSVYDFQRAGA